MNKATLIISILVITMYACGPGKKTRNNKDKDAPVGLIAIPQQGYMVYKTNADYFEKVPIQLSEDKTGVISYPAASDLKKQGEFTYPVKLSGDYLLDRRGIGPHTAFLEWDYEKYYKSGGAQSTMELLNLIIDADPFIELYHCPSNIDEKAVIGYINDLILSEQLNVKCKRIK
jgi:hypothetical protein